MSSATRAGTIYFAIVFAVGFVLGTIRVLAVVPRVGETAAVMIEVPAMLALSWVVCAWLVRRIAVPSRVVDRLVMGGLAFALLMAAEVGVSVFAFGRTLTEHLQSFEAAPARLGLAAQVIFVVLPLVEAMRRH